MKRLTILVDIDGVVADMLPAWLLRIYEKTGVLASIDDVTTWEMSAPPLSEVSRDSMLDILNEPGFNLGLPVFTGADVYLKQLHEAGHKIYFVTARWGPVIMPETLSWMRKHFPWLQPEKHLCFIHDKSLLAGDVLVDDRMDNLVAYRAAHPRADLIAIDYPYNRIDVDGVYRVAYDREAWAKIYERIVILSMVDNENIH